MISQIVDEPFDQKNNLRYKPQQLEIGFVRFIHFLSSIKFVFDPSIEITVVKLWNEVSIKFGEWIITLSSCGT